MNATFNNLVGKVIKRLFLIVWPPLGEDEISNTDISIGFILADHSANLYNICIDKDDNWTPILVDSSLPSKIYTWSDFEFRINKWMNSEIDEDLEEEFYEITDDPKFRNISGNKIVAVDTISVDQSTPFGVKIILETDFIQVTPISDGTTVETSFFNQNNNIEHFQKLGTVQFISLSNAMPSIPEEE
jgi:hypothetical protein